MEKKTCFVLFNFWMCKKKKIYLDKLTYWNVELQEAYFSYIEADKKREELIKKS